MNSSISTDVLGVVALCFTIIMAKRHALDSNNTYRRYIVVAVLTISILLFEIATLYFKLYINNDYIIPNKICNILGFSLSPVIPFYLFKINYNKGLGRTINKILILPLLVNTVICIISYRVNLVFSIDAQNVYSRGPLFLLPLIASIIYFVLLIIAIFKNRGDFEIEDRKAFAWIVLVPIVAVILQIMFENLIIIWVSVALSLMLYYVFLRETQFTYDQQTGVKNRKAFEKEMERLTLSNKDIAICVFDINNLKKTNDLYGHKAGDVFIAEGAKIIKNSFQNFGKVFRIGGDEFCVICEDANKNDVVNAMEKLDKTIMKVNKKRTNKLVLAHGFAIYNKRVNDNIYSIFTEADKLMYENKAKLKTFFGNYSYLN